MTERHELLYEFGPYILDGRERVLMRDGQPVALAPKAVDTLLVLLRNSGHLVEKNQLMSEVWPSTYVEEQNLTQNISILRKVLSDGTAASNYIETVPRRGYRFLVSVRRVSDGASRQTTEEAGIQEFGVQTYRSLAILPFVNASADEKIDYLSEGITESIINSLSQLPQLRIMSRNAVFRYKGKEIDAQRIGRDLGVDAVLVGRVNLLGRRLQVSTELVDVANGWQLWGENYDRASKAILEVQEEIPRQISAALRLRLTGDEEQRLTRRYTESAEAYQAYLQGRYHWSKFTRDGLDQATVFFRQAINLDRNYALAYAGIVDCYLRLATNYIPPADTLPQPTEGTESRAGHAADTEAALGPVKTRYKWDWTGVERELKRATELKSSYPATHQWQAAYLFSLNLYRESLRDSNSNRSPMHFAENKPAIHDWKLLAQPEFSSPTLDEEVQIHCTIVREQIEVGNYEAAYAALQKWWIIGELPNLEGLSPFSAADLLYTAGVLAGCIGSSRQVRIGQKHAEALLNRAIALLEHLGSRTGSAEARIELACCYYREGLFDLARTTLTSVLKALQPHDRELRSLGLIRLAVIERHAGLVRDSLARLNEVSEIAELTGPWATARYHQELASTLKDLASSESERRYFDLALEHYRKALDEFEAVGNHRYSAVVENNHGFMLLTFGHLEEGEKHLCRARKLFDGLSDRVRRAQVDETLARLYIVAQRLDSAEDAVAQAVATLETGDEEALLAEALTTKGLVLYMLGRHSEARGTLEGGYRVAERCGYIEGAGRALSIVVEQMLEELGPSERRELATRLKKLLAYPIPPSRQQRLQKCLGLIEAAN
jgi:TolB-like protein/predicted negative regulator of RcsB-dependent stress response